MPQDNSSATEWSLTSVLNEIKRIHNAMPDRRFVFILGAGASVSSGIKSANALAYDWIKLIHSRYAPEQDFQEWLDSNPLNIEDWESNNLAKHYPKIFETCFEGDHDSGYAELEQAIENGKPSIGYAVLAWILSETNHRMVITTNFDNLVADSLAIYGSHTPHVIGHESLAHYIKPITRRSLIAKIHRDLFTDPINTDKGTSELQQNWINSLKNVFKFHTPIFIGYGGNDGSLMGFLEKLDTEDISGRPFWCYYQPDGKPNGNINQLITKHKGVLVPTNGFDELMLKLGDCFDYDLSQQRDLLKQRTENLIEQFETQSEKFSQNSSSEVKKLMQPKDNDFDKNDWWEWQLKINALDDIEEQDKLYQKALKTLHNSPELLCNYAHFLETKKNDYDNAKKYYQISVEVAPKHSHILGSYAIFLRNRKQDYDKAEEYYLKALKVAPEHSRILASYATYLQEIKKDYDKAEHHFLRSLEVAPKDPNTLANYSYFLLLQFNDNQAVKYLDNLPKSKNQIEAETLFYRVWINRKESSVKNNIQQLKTLINNNFERLSWSFKQLIKKRIDDFIPEDQDFIIALSEAILDEKAVEKLNDFKQWQEAQLLEHLNAKN